MLKTAEVNVKEVAQTAQRASRELSFVGRLKKDCALTVMGKKLAGNKNDILKANEQDVKNAEESGLPANLVDRLLFTEARIESRIRSLEKIAALEDPIGQSFWQRRTFNGLQVSRVRVPLGVILMIYEARPHVTVNAGAFCIKSGNAAILRGGSEAKTCNQLLGRLWRESLEEAQINPDAVQVISGSHKDVDVLLQQDEFIDLVIPRGGKGLIKAVADKSKIPVVKHYSGVCHVYVDEVDKVQSAIEIALDSKCLMPEVCNAMETLLVSEKMEQNIAKFVQAFREFGVAVKGCKKTQQAADGVEPATEDDWRTEYLDNIVSIRMVRDVEHAIEHINKYGSHHTDSIVTDKIENAERFAQAVDSAVVLVNASTMFCDGQSLGMGAEIGISTDKLHARGPMGLEELTSYKFVIRGKGHIMGKPRMQTAKRGRI